MDCYKNIENLETIKIEETVEGAVAIKFLMKKHKADLMNVYFWLYRCFDHYQDQELEYCYSKRESFGHYFSRQDLLKFKPTDAIILISIEDLVYKKYYYKNTNLLKYFEDYQEDEIFHLLDWNVKNNKLVPIDGSEFCTHYKPNEIQFLIKEEIDYINEKYKNDLDILENSALFIKTDEIENKKKEYYKELKRIMPLEMYASWGPERFLSDDKIHILEPCIKTIEYDLNRKILYVFVKGTTYFYRDWIIDNHLDYHEKAAELIYGKGTIVLIKRD